MSSPAEAVIDLYRRHAAAWASARAAAAVVEQAWLARFECELTPDAEVLDIGCGPGELIARLLLGAGHRVIGVDSSPEMIAMFRANCPDVIAMVADMRHLALGRTFGGLLAWDSFFHLSCPDQRAMFPIFATHAAPGAPLMFTSGPAEGEAIGELEGEPLYHASLSGAAYRRLLDKAGFDVLAQRNDVLAQRNEDSECGGRTVWLAKRR